MDREIVLTRDDPTIFTKCMSCCKTGMGVPVGQYFSKAYTKRQWSQDPVCENCGTRMSKLYEVQ